MNISPKEFIRTKTLKTITLISILLMTAVFFIVKVHEYDIWFHLSAGKYIINNFRVPLYDPFSYTAADRFYIDSHWLYQVILYIFYGSMGYFGVFLYQLLVIGVMLYVMFQVSKKSDFYAASISFLLMLLLIAPRFLFRPEMFSYLFAVLFVVILHKYCMLSLRGIPPWRETEAIPKDEIAAPPDVHRGTRNDGRIIFLLPVIQVLWTNMHGFFIFGPVIVGCYFIGELIQQKRIIKPILLAGILCILACFINPYGWRLAAYPFLLFTEIGSGASAYTKSVTELTPTLLAEQTNYSRTVYMLLIAVSLASFFLSRKISISRLLVYSVFLYISWVTVRNTAFFAVVVYLLVIFNLDALRDIKIPASQFILKTAGYACMAAVIIVSGSVSYRIVTDRYYRYGSVIKKFGIGKVDIMYPADAVKFIKDRNITGNIFNDALLGGYFMWECYPERKVFFDGRMEVYGEEFLAKYKSVTDNPAVYWKVLADEYEISYVLLHPLSPHSKNLIKHLYKNRLWKLAYLDESGIIFTRSGYKIESVVKEPDISPYAGNPSAKIPGYLSFANFFYETGQYEKAKPLYTEILKLEPHFAEAYVNLASVFMAEEKYNDAKACYKRAIQESKKYAEPFLGLAVIYLKEERYDIALENVKYALRIKPVFPEAQLLLGYIYQKAGHYAESIKIYKELISRHPADENIHNFLGTAYYLNKNYAEAVKEFQKALEINPNSAEAKNKYMICIDKINEGKKKK